MRVYIAGPDVFRPDVSTWAAHVRGRLAERGHHALMPIDGEENTAGGIYRANLAMIRSADALIANLNPFRGDEPDSGTCFEVGYATALGTPVLAYLDDGRPLKDKLGSAGDTVDVPTTDADGWQVEDFGLPLNLMLALPCRIVFGGIDAAIDALDAIDALAARVDTA